MSWKEIFDIMHPKRNQNNVIQFPTAENKESAFITRLNSEADGANQNKTLESMRDELNEYLGDVDNVIEEFPELPEYTNKSDGYLKIRKPNQSIKTCISSCIFL